MTSTKLDTKFKELSVISSNPVRRSSDSFKTKKRKDDKSSPQPRFDFDFAKYQSYNNQIQSLLAHTEQRLAQPNRLVLDSKPAEIEIVIQIPTEELLENKQQNQAYAEHPPFSDLPGIEDAKNNSFKIPQKLKLSQINFDSQQVGYHSFKVSQLGQSEGQSLMPFINAKKRGSNQANASPNNLGSHSPATTQLSQNPKQASPMSSKNLSKKINKKIELIKRVYEKKESKKSLGKEVEFHFISPSGSINQNTYVFYNATQPPLPNNYQLNELQMRQTGGFSNYSNHLNSELTSAHRGQSRGEQRLVQYKQNQMKKQNSIPALSPSPVHDRAARIKVLSQQKQQQSGTRFGNHGLAYQQSGVNPMSQKNGPNSEKKIPGERHNSFRGLSHQVGRLQHIKQGDISKKSPPGIVHLQPSAQKRGSFTRPKSYMRKTSNKNQATGVKALEEPVMKTGPKYSKFITTGPKKQIELQKMRASNVTAKNFEHNKLVSGHPTQNRGDLSEKLDTLSNLQSNFSNQNTYQNLPAAVPSQGMKKWIDPQDIGGTPNQKVQHKAVLMKINTQNISAKGQKESSPSRQEEPIHFTKASSESKPKKPSFDLKEKGQSQLSTDSQKEDVTREEKRSDSRKRVGFEIDLKSNRQVNVSEQDSESHELKSSFQEPSPNITCSNERVGRPSSSSDEGGRSSASDSSSLINDRSSHSLSSPQINSKGGFLQLPAQQLKKKNTTVCAKIMITNLAADNNISDKAGNGSDVSSQQQKKLPSLQRLQTTVTGGEIRGALGVPRLKEKHAQFLTDVLRVRKQLDNNDF